ncbi:RidA family protein [Pseudanabaena sp. UWO311]|uniref:RidA family protein n=1 Tax=Pseudanabaena sp. UWO311 TaxID=2487337 RepID=UPI0011579502|nr:RidA family protein [Pseudanabaena sp. UWO311]TYQ27781.1 RidA family protein [Pseudanabaena sp. UWO311]
MNRNFTNDVIARLAELGLELPQNPPSPAGDYAPFRLHAGIGFLSAQTSGYDGKFSGQVGSVLTLTQGQEAAQKAALNALSRIHQALDGFDRLIGLLHVAGHVCSAPDFFDQPEVLDGASRVFNHVLGDRGLHSRTAYAQTHLPKHITIELEITFAYREILHI